MGFAFGVTLHAAAQPVESGSQPTEVQTPAPVSVQAEGPVTLINAASPNPELPPPDPNPPSDRTPGPDIDAPYPKRGHFVLQLEGRASIESFHSDGVFMGGAGLTLMADTKVGSFGGGITGEGGRTEQGLKTLHFDMGAEASWPVGPMRLGLSPRLGFIDVARITRNSVLTYVTYAIEGIVGVDAYRGDGVEVAFVARPRAEYGTEFFGDDAGWLLGGTLGVELRWRAPRRSAPFPRATAYRQ